MGKVLKANAPTLDAWVRADFGSNQSEVWVTFGLAFTSAALAVWTSGTSGYLCDALRSTGVRISGCDIDTGLWELLGSGVQSAVPPPVAETFQTIEFHIVDDGTLDLYVDGAFVITDSAFSAASIRKVRIGLIDTFADPDNVAYFDNVLMGTTRGAGDLFADDFEDGTLDAWTTTSGDVSVVDDPFPATAIEGIVWAPDDAALEVNPTWVRLDADPYRLATSYQIIRGRSSETDKVTTGTATVAFRDTTGILDPTNPSSPFWDSDLNITKLDPMTQAAISLKNPITDEWHTLFRGFVAENGHDLDMFTQEQGFDVVTWSLVDAFDLFANVILTHGTHGDTPSLASFPNIYYQGTPSNLPGESDVFVHVDQRIAKLLDDAGWPGTGNTIDVDNLRNIFSGNVSVQGTVYSRLDSLLSALFDACDAEFPGIGNFYMSKDGVATFHGRFARFFPDRPGYNINHWYVGNLQEAALDPTIIPHTSPLQFHRSKDDIIDASYALPQGVDETDGGVVHSSDATSISKYGYRSNNFDGLIVSAGHGVPGDDNAPTTAVQEANKFAAYYVGNYATPQDRVGTLRFTGRSPEMVGAPALWDFLTRVELGDVVTLTSAHAGGGGFDADFFVEQIRYTVSPGKSNDLPNVVCEAEVSPATFFSYNPFGSHDSGDS